MDSTSHTRRTIRRPTRARVTIALLGLGAIGLAACGGSQSASSYGSSAPTTATRAAADSLASTTNAALGQVILVDGSGRTVYLFVPDGSSAHSTVPAAIKANWPAVTSTNSLRAGSGLQRDALSVQTQPDGTRQVAYAGHLLYTFVGDQRVGDANGQGLTGKWYVVSPAGTPIGQGASASSPGASPAPSTPAPATPATTSSPAPRRGNDGDADNKGGPNDDDGNK
jgi:predicted lipoprotein with Yx(FWY)xxD motif